MIVRRFFEWMHSWVGRGLRALVRGGRFGCDGGALSALGCGSCVAAAFDGCSERSG